MARCCASIPLEGVFGLSGEAKSSSVTSDAGEDDIVSLSPVDASLLALRQSVECGEAWRAAYRKTQQLQNESAAKPGSTRKPWNLKESSIFAQNRCLRTALQSLGGGLRRKYPVLTTRSGTTARLRGNEQVLSSPALSSGLGDKGH